MTKILVVDDEADSLSLMELFLTGQGFEVHAAESAATAIALAEAVKPDLLVTDYVLREEQSGLDVIRTLRASFTDLPALLLTGMARSEVKRELETIANVRVLQKPVSLNALSAAVQDCIEA